MRGILGGAAAAATVACALLVSSLAPARAFGAGGLQQDEVARQVAELRREFKRAKRPELRLQLLEQAAELARARPDDPPPEVARFLGEALSDDDVAVRLGALPLLVQGQAPEPVVEALIDGWKAATKQWARMDKLLKKWNKDRGGGYSKRDLVDAQDGDWMMRGGRYFELLIATLGVVRDERTEALLIDILESRPNAFPGRFFSAACHAAQELGTVAVLEAELECLAGIDRALARKTVRVRYPRERGPLILTDVWLANFHEVNDRRLEQMLDRLDEYAAAQVPAAVPPGGRDQEKAWKEWLEANRGAFATDLGRLTEPVRAEVTLPSAEEEG